MININNIPTSSGVYFFKNNKKILYIGKAKNLKKRISSYFQKNHNDIKTSFLVKKIKQIDWIVTNNEFEALILENNLIKKHKPPFNIKLTDDKTYPYIKIDFSHEFPNIQITRNKKDDKSIYFGPYSTVLKLKEVVRFINKNFLIRKCSNKKFNNRNRPCLNYQIKICPAPCVNKIDQKEYRNRLKQVILFLKGKNEKLIKKLTDEMLKLSTSLQFEEAAKLRDLIESVKIISTNQVVETFSLFDKDIFYSEYMDDNLYFIVLKTKKGKVIASDFYSFKNFKTFSKNIFEDFILKYYSIKTTIPDKIILHKKINSELIKKFFKKKFNKTPELVISSNDNDDINLINLAKENLKQKIRILTEKERLPNKLKNFLKLKSIPNRIDAFDIATFRGKSSVGTRVVFVNGKPFKSLYRKYKIKTIGENFLDDFSMINEIVDRSAKEYIESDNYPDLILIDGGKGQLNSAIYALKQHGIENKINIIAIAKDKDEKIDKIYLPKRKNYLNISKNRDIILFFMKIRDEVHRFSVKYHHQKEHSKNFNSILKNINGIGDKKAKLLIKHFKNINKIKEATLPDLESLPFLNKKIAQNIYNFFNN